MSEHSTPSSVSSSGGTTEQTVRESIRIVQAMHDGAQVDIDTLEPEVREEVDAILDLLRIATRSASLGAEEAETSDAPTIRREMLRHFDEYCASFGRPGAWGMQSDVFEIICGREPARRPEEKV